MPARRGKSSAELMTTDTTTSRRSLHERVMADPEQCHAYFHTTEACLLANPEHKDTDAILKVLDDNEVVYLYDPATCYPRPRLNWLGNLSIGLDEITEAARRIKDSRPPPGVCRWCSSSESVLDGSR